MAAEIVCGVCPDCAGAGNFGAAGSGAREAASGRFAFGGGAQGSGSAAGGSSDDEDGEEGQGDSDEEGGLHEDAEAKAERLSKVASGSGSGKDKGQQLQPQPQQRGRRRGQQQQQQHRGGAAGSGGQQQQSVEDEAALLVRGLRGLGGWGWRGMHAIGLGCGACVSRAAGVGQESVGSCHLDQPAPLAGGKVWAATQHIHKCQRVCIEVCGGTTASTGAAGPGMLPPAGSCAVGCTCLTLSGQGAQGLRAWSQGATTPCC